MSSSVRSGSAAIRSSSHCSMVVQRRAAMASAGLGLDAAGRRPALDPADRRRGTHVEQTRRLPRAVTCLDYRDDPLPQIFRVSLRHRVPRRRRRKTESDLHARGNPYNPSDSDQAGTALANHSLRNNTTKASAVIAHQNGHDEQRRVGPNRKIALSPVRMPLASKQPFAARHDRFLRRENRSLMVHRRLAVGLVGAFLRDRAVGYAEAPLRGSSPLRASIPGAKKASWPRIAFPAIGRSMAAAKSESADRVCRDGLQVGGEASDARRGAPRCPDQRKAFVPAMTARAFT